MNLRFVHAVVILFSAAAAVLFGVWCLDQYGQTHATGSLVGAITAFTVSLGLVIYDSWFLRKTKALR